MVKRRLIPVLYIKNGLIVRSEGFNYHQNIGNIINQAVRYNEWDVDELIYIDISQTKDYDLRRDDHKIKSYSTIEEIIHQIAKVCFMPLSFGGGIRTLAEVDFRIQNGADKIVINTGAFENPGLIKEIAGKYGSQCVIVSIDYRIIENKPIVCTRFGNMVTGIEMFDWVIKAVENGAGEIFLNSIDRDGKGDGYDIETINKVVNLVNIPVIACGGAGDLSDFVELATQTNVSGIAAGNLFHFTERSYPRAKKLMLKNKINIR